MLNLEPIKARARAATEGPWKFIVDDDNIIVDVAEGSIFFTDWYTENPKDNPKTALAWARAIKNNTFAAHARTDIPALVAEVEALREALIKFANVTALQIQSDFKKITATLTDWGHDAPPTT